MGELAKVLFGEGQHDERWIHRPQLVGTYMDLRARYRDATFSLNASIGLEMELLEALRLRTLRVAYQPQFHLASGRGCGVEALARWVRPSGEIVPPSAFIRLAERSDMIRDLGAWVLQSACATAAAWGSRASQGTILSVNVSALQIDEEFSTTIEQVLEQTGFPANRLELEITESALIANPALTIEHLNTWKELGVRIAMDDFGTGYSSLSYLSRLPVDRLKLDRSLIHRMTLDKKSAAIMRLIVSLGAELDMEVIAEGVETEEHLQILTDLGCPQVQGYLLGRPMPAEQVLGVLGEPWGSRYERMLDRDVNARRELHAH
jgi:EAL domain-containing protein (putative c-di-GMP-specific phosphodiesterase class I)